MTVKEKAPEMLQDYLNGMILKDIGAKHGVTHQRVQQILSEFPAYRAKRNRGITEAELLREEKKRENSRRFCRCCGKEFSTTDGGYSFCTKKHGQYYWYIYRYYTTDDQRMRQAKSNLRCNDPERREYGQRVLNGAPKNRKFVSPSSKIFSVLVEAYRNDWPLFDLLPEEYQEIVRAKWMET